MTIRFPIIAALVMGCASASTPTLSTPKTSASVEESITEADVRRILSTLAADSMEGRLTGSRGADRAAAFIVRELKSIGIKPAGENGTYFQKVPFASTTTTGQRARLTLLDSMGALNKVPEPARVIGNNIIGVVQGTDPVLRNEIVAFAAHYDGLGIAKPINGDSIYNGADDDASGVTAILSIARAFSKSSPPRRTILFMLTTGEEEGILGTEWYVRHPVYPLSSMVAEMEVEMAGRPDSLAGGRGKLWMTGFERSTMGSMLKEAGIPIVPDPYPRFRFFERSDNIVFALQGIPAHTLSSYNLHQDYHAPSDDVNGIDFPHLTQISRAAYQAARLLTDGPAPKWNPGGKPESRRSQPR